MSAARPKFILFVQVVAQLTFLQTGPFRAVFVAILMVYLH